MAISAISKDQGVFFLSERLARGFDLKFAVSAFVVVYAAKFYYMSSTITQMIGRANRSQEVQSGRVFCTFEALIDEYVEWDFYVQREKLGFSQFGLRIMKAVLTIFNSLNLKQKAEVTEVLKGTKWSKLTRLQFEQSGLTPTIIKKFQQNW